MLRFLAAVGAAFLTFLATTGRLALFAGMSLATAFTPPFYPAFPEQRQGSGYSAEGEVP